MVLADRVSGSSWFSAETDAGRLRDGSRRRGHHDDRHRGGRPRIDLAELRDDLAAALTARPLTGRCRIEDQAAGHRNRHDDVRRRIRARVLHPGREAPFLAAHDAGRRGNEAHGEIGRRPRSKRASVA